MMPSVFVEESYPARGVKKLMGLPVVILKVRLTEESSLAIFGDLHPHRNYCMPPLFSNERREAVAEIDEEQAEVYNSLMRRIYRSTMIDKPDFDIETKLIKSGKVIVREGQWNLILENTDDR